jgi:hypothetical protein
LRPAQLVQVVVQVLITLGKSTCDYSELQLVTVNGARNAFMGEGAISVTPFSAVVNGLERDCTVESIDTAAVGSEATTATTIAAMCASLLQMSMFCKACIDPNGAVGTAQEK